MQLNEKDLLEKLKYKFEIEIKNVPYMINWYDVDSFSLEEPIEPLEILKTSMDLYLPLNSITIQKINENQNYSQKNDFYTEKIYVNSFEKPIFKKYFFKKTKTQEGTIYYENKIVITTKIPKGLKINPELLKKIRLYTFNKIILNNIKDIFTSYNNYFDFIKREKIFDNNDFENPNLNFYGEFEDLIKKQKQTLELLYNKDFSNHNNKAIQDLIVEIGADEKQIKDFRSIGKGEVLDFLFESVIQIHQTKSKICVEEFEANFQNIINTYSNKFEYEGENIEETKINFNNLKEAQDYYERNNNHEFKVKNKTFSW